MSNYRKAIAAVLTAIAVCLQAFFGIGDGSTLAGMPVDSLVNVAITLLGAFGVYRVANRPA